jgi:opacity protein-like surface antigen
MGQRPEAGPRTGTRRDRRGRRWTILGLALSSSLGCLLATPGPAAAQVSFGLGLHGGVGQSADADDTNGFFGAHARLRLLGFLGLEGAVDYRQEEFAKGLLEVNTVPVTVSALLYPIPVGPLQPYLVGGIGWYFSDLEVAGGQKTDTSDVGVHVGAGLDIRLGSSWALHGDVRYIWRDLDTSDVDISDQDADSWQVGFGLTYYFF